MAGDTRSPLASLWPGAYLHPMADETGRPAPPEWLDALAEGQADIAADDSSPLSEARARLAVLQDALKAEQARRRA
jgi:hypothetical protein